MFRFIPSLLLATALSAFGQGTQVSLSGLLTDSAGAPVAGATVKLENLGVTVTSGADGRFSLGSTGLVPRAGSLSSASAGIREGAFFLSLPARAEVAVTASTLEGRELSVLRRDLAAGSYALPLAGLGTGLRFLAVEAGGFRTVLKAYAFDGALHGAAAPEAPGLAGSARALAKPASPRAPAAAALYDVLTASKSGFQTAYVAISNSDSSNIQIKMLKEGSAKFSFFVTSMRTLVELAKNEKGFGGDFRFGETGPGAGLRGADKICATIAEKSMPGSKVKGWRAFLSVTADAHGKQVNAIDRVGPGPWYDRTGRLLAPTKADLVDVRPKNGDPVIRLDLPNEFGIPNNRPDPSQPAEDNHHTVTGCDANGKLKSATATCKDWTTSVHSTENGKPSAGFSWPRGGQVGTSGSHWMTTWDAPGCAAGIEIVQGGGPSQQASQGGWIGGGGGYGGFYCFALNP